jgi:hypothetical protein
MKKLISLFFLVIICSCVREDETTTCYSYLNGTSHNIKLEFYSFTNSANGNLTNSFEKNGEGLIIKKCAADMGISFPYEVYKYDSVIVKFNDVRKLTYTISNDSDSHFFSPSFLQRDGNSFNHTYEFTEEDFNNADPY